MLNVIELESVENEIIRRRLAHKILSDKTNISYADLLEMLKTGGVEYLATENKTAFEEAMFELHKLGVKYKIKRKDSPEKSETVKMQTVKTQQIPSVKISGTAREAVPETEPLIFSESEPEEKNESSPKTRFAKTIKLDKRKGSSYPLLDFAKKLNLSENENVKSAVSITVFLAVIIAVLYFLSQADTRREFRGESGRGAQTAQSSRSSGGGAGASTESSRQNQTAQQRQQQSQQRQQFNNAMAEADNACVQGAVDMERFYRFAISFNRNNMRAWKGLLDCLERRGDSARAAEIRREMQRLFGENVFQITKNVEAHGTIENFSSEDKVYRLTYFRSENAGPVERELFSIGQNIVISGSFERAVIFAKESENSGYMISFSTANFPRTLEQFKRKITINKVGK